jgi:hypothetical protein
MGIFEKGEKRKEGRPRNSFKEKVVVWYPENQVLLFIGNA